MNTNLKFGDSVIINGEKVGTIVGPEKDGLVPVDYIKINENKQPLALPVIIYVNKNGLTIENGKNQKGGTGKYKSKGSENFHILTLEEKDGISYALYGYFKNNNLHLFRDSAPSVETGETGKINYDKITHIIASVEFQDIIAIDNDIERTQIASHFLEKIKFYYKIVKFSLNQENIAGAEVERLKISINEACQIYYMEGMMEGIFDILRKTQLRKKGGKEIVLSEKIEKFIANLTKCIGVGCEKKNLKSLFKAFCKIEGQETPQTNKIRGEAQMTLNTHVDKIINAFLPDKNTLERITLLNSVKYTGTKIELDNESELGKLFNMEYVINQENEITKATLSYNLIGFLMLMTELDHDFNDVKEIKQHLPTINKNFYNVAELMKDKLIGISGTKGKNSQDEQLFNNVFGSLDKENPKLKEEEMGRIITAMISEDDMPRVIAADNRVYLQYYAPKSLKGNMPSFYNVGQIHQKTEEKEEGNKIEQFLQYVLNNEDGKHKILLSDFKKMIDIDTNNLENQKKSKKEKLGDNKNKDIKKSDSGQEKILIERLYDASITALENRYENFKQLKIQYDKATFKPITKLALKAYKDLEIDLEENIKIIDDEYDNSLKKIKNKYENDMSQSQDNTESQETGDVSSIDTDQSQVDKDFEKNKKELFEEYKNNVLNENKRLNDLENLINKMDQEKKDLLQELINEYNSKSPSNPFMKDIMSFYNTDIYFTSDADNKAAYVLANSKNMKPITKEKHPFLSLDAGSSPQLPINNEYYDYFNRLHNEDNSDPITPPTIVVKNPLNGSDLVKITYNNQNKKYDLLIKVTEEVNINETILNINETIKDLNKTSMSNIMKQAIDLYNNNVIEGEPQKTNENYQLLLFGASILKSLGDLVCYITVNMQEFLKSGVEDQENTMFLCNSADYSMFYPLLGNFIFNKDSSDYTIARKYNKTNMYLSCSVKSTQNFFVPLTQHEQIKLYLIKLMYTKDARRFQLLEEVLSFQEKYGKPGSFNNKLIYKIVKGSTYKSFETVEDEESIALFTDTNYTAFKDAYKGEGNKDKGDKDEGNNSLLYHVSEMYLIFVYLSKLYYFQNKTPEEEIHDLKMLLKESKILNEIKILNRDIFQEHTFDLNTIRTQWERLELIADYQVDEEGIFLNFSDKMRRYEILESFLFKEQVQFTDVEITNDGWKYAYLYATILKKVGDNHDIYNYLNSKSEEQKEKEAAKAAEAAEAAEAKNKYEEEKDKFAANSVNDNVEEDIKIEEITEALENAIINDIEGQRPTDYNPPSDYKPSSDYGGKRRSNSKKKSKKDKKRQTRKANN